MPVITDLNDALGTLPSGSVFRLTDDGLTKYLRDNYMTQSEDARKADARMRIDLYRDRGEKHFSAMLDKLFKNQKVRDWRKQFLEYAQFQNVTKRVIREISAVYSEPAVRRVNDEGQSMRYRDLQGAVRMDRRMRLVNRMGNLLNNVLVWPWVNDIGDPVLRVVTPDRFSAIAHPNDPTLPVGFVVDRFPGRDKKGKSGVPHYLVIDGQTFFHLDADWRMVSGSRRPHMLNRLPAMLFSREEMDDGILDADSGKDLVSAHCAVALLNTLMLKHQKSGTRQAYASGDMSTTGLGQPMDEEHLLTVGEGVTLNTLDLGADPDNYINATRAVIKQVAANYGIPESVFDLSYQATSGFEIELKRTGLREVRRDQILDFRPFERDLALLMSDVLRAAGSDYAFDVAGWSIDFGEVETPQDPSARMGYFSQLEDMDLMNRVEMYRYMNPEATEEEAIEAIASNAERRINRMVLFQQAQQAAHSADNQPSEMAAADEEEHA